MGTKRKSEDPESVTTEKSITKKRKKKHRHDKEKHKDTENGSPMSSTSSRKSSKSRSNSPDKPASIKSRISQLQQLIEELASNPEAVRECTGQNGFQLVHAMAELERAFGRTAPTAPKDPKDPKDPKPSRPQLSSLLPPAPPIKNPTLETAAFTHHGTISSAQAVPGKEVSYDRLEVLGDAYLEVIATRLIWDQFKTLPAGRLSQARELLVKNETLAEYSVKYGFDKRARVPPDYVNQPKRWLKTKGDIFEAYVAAVILADPVNGFDLAEEWLTQLWLPKLNEFQPVETQLTAKEELTRRVMGKGIKLRYVDERPSVRNGGLQTFFIGVYLTGWGWTDQHLGSGTGLNKVIAGNEAAKRALANRPLIDEINAVKRAFDEKTRLQREEAGT